MKRSPVSLFLLIILFVGSMACKADDDLISPTTDAGNNANNKADSIDNRLKIRVGSCIFTATLLRNATVTAFKAVLPLTVTMSELNGNEKLYKFPQSLPTNPSRPGTIQTGDLMIYSSNTLVLFYKSFPTVYSYTKLGRIDNPSGLAAALGAANITVTFELE